MAQTLLSALVLFSSCASARVACVVDAAVAGPIADRRYAGVVLVARGGHPLLEKAYGFDNTPDTQFMIMSVSKQFTAAAIMRLVAQGKLALDDRVSKYLDEWPSEWDSVELRHLLSHSSGLPIDATYFWLVKHHPEFWSGAPQPPPEFVSQPLVAPPGTKYQYANVGYTLLTLIAAKAAGCPWDDVLRDEVLRPLQLTHTQPERNGMRVTGRARGHERTNSGFELSEQQTIDVVGAGDLVSTAQDLARFDAAFDDNRFLLQVLRDQMLTPHIEGTRGASIGYGWFLRTSPAGRRLQYHTGDGAGFRAFNFRVPDERLSVVVLSNVHESEMPWILPLVDRIADALGSPVAR